MLAVLKFLAVTKTGRVVAAGLVLTGLFASVYALGGSHARLKDKARDLEAALSIEQERAHDDVYLQSLSDDDLCIEYFRNSGRVSDEAECRALRGLQGE